MNIKDRVGERPDGITYLTTGGVREDILEIATIIEGMRSGRGEELTDEDFRSTVLSGLEEMRAQIDELYNGMNFLGDVLRKAKLME